MEIASKTFQVKKICLEQDEKAEGTFIIFRDMTELREKERELIVKSVAIREIHHRVKNNLQTVASLLRLQMRRGVPEESKVHFVESLNRILSIAHVYEIILSNSSVDDVEVYSLIEKIGNMLIDQPEGEPKTISINYKGPRLTIKSNKAVSVALIINELIQNSMKHAFHNRCFGNIHVSFYVNGLECIVKVEDDGVGYSDSSKPSLGLEIVKMMTEHDLSGQFSIQRTETGTMAAIVFPMERE
jgi:two-component sensor histidine kinase